MRNLPQDQISHSESAVRNDQPLPRYMQPYATIQRLVFLWQKYSGTRNRIRSASRTVCIGYITKK